MNHTPSIGLLAIALGIEQGREEGEQQATRAIARNLLDRLDDETIAQTTGLSVEAVRELRQEQMPG